MKNNKSDVNAKLEYIKTLENKGYENVHVTASPADITAEKDGKTYYFEIKMTMQKEKYFGAATFTEWEEAFNNPENYTFVIAKTNESEDSFEFTELSPEEFMSYCTIPPMKVYFNYSLDGKKSKKTSKKSKSVKLTKENFMMLNSVFKSLKPNHDDTSA